MFAKNNQFQLERLSTREGIYSVALIRRQKRLVSSMLRKRVSYFHTPYFLSNVIRQLDRIHVLMEHTPPCDTEYLDR